MLSKFIHVKKQSLLLLQFKVVTFKRFQGTLLGGDPPNGPPIFQISLFMVSE